MGKKKRKDQKESWERKRGRIKRNHGKEKEEGSKGNMGKKKKKDQKESCERKRGRIKRNHGKEKEEGSKA